MRLHNLGGKPMYSNNSEFQEGGGGGSATNDHLKEFVGRPSEENATTPTPTPIAKRNETNGNGNGKYSTMFASAIRSAARPLASRVSTAGKCNH